MRVFTTLLLASLAWGQSRAARQGMVSTAHPLATEAGVAILERGGNAFDAAVAVAATLNVVEPQNSGVGGYGLILIYAADQKKVRVLNASGRTPQGVDPDAFRSQTPGFVENRAGAKAIGTPVNLRAWEELSKKYGKLAWKDLFSAAIRHSGEGFVLTEAIPPEAFRQFPEPARSFYGNNGRPLGAGDRLFQKDLARSLGLIAAEGAKALHGGVLGKALDAEMRRLGAFLRLEDLVVSKAEWWEPIEIDYRGQRVITASPPANSFSALVRLGIMSRFDARSLGHNSVEYLHRFAEATKHGEWCRVKYAGDPELNAPPLARLLSMSYWKDQAAAIDPARAREWTPPGASCTEGLETTHFAVADRWGNVVTATQTIGQGFGCRVMIPGTGIWLNNSLYYSTFEPKGNPMDVYPGRRKLNSNTPAFVMRNGRPWIAIGAAGGHTIPQTVPQIVMNMADFGLDIQSALAAPRVAFVEPGELQIEEGVPQQVRQQLAARGHKLRVTSAIGRLHGLSIEYDGAGRPASFRGGFDPRGKGLAKGY